MHIIADSLEPAKDFFKTIAKCLDPDSYNKFSRKSMPHALTYLLGVVALATLLLGVLMIPTLVNMPETITDTLSQFDVLSLTLEFSTKEPIHLDFEPILSTTVAIDTSKATNLSDDQTDTVLVDAETITVRKQSAHCMLRSFVSKVTVFGFGFAIPEDCYEQYTITDTDLLNEKETVSKLVWLWILYSLPLLYLWLIVKLYVGYVALALAMVLLTGLVLKGLHSKVGYIQNIKLALYALTIPMIVDIASTPFDTQLYGIHWFIGLGYYILSLYLSGGDDEKGESEMKKVAGGKKPIVWKKD